MPRAWQPAFALGMLMLAGCATTAPPPADPMASLGSRLLEGYIRPHARELHASTTRLQVAVDTYCAQPADDARRREVDTRLAGVVTSWAGVEFLRFGPLVEQNRLEQFFFWPDPRGVMQRQMRALLAAADPALLEATSLQAQSVAVQGLPALEYLLHADDAPRLIAAGTPAGTYRCAFAGAVSGNLVRLAAAIEAGWGAGSVFASEFARPDASHDLYRSSGEVATEVLKAMSTALHVARDQKIVPALGEDAASARGTLAPLYRSGLTARYLAAGAAALAQWQATADFAAALPADSTWVDASLRDELQRVQEDFATLPVPVDQAVSDAGQRDVMVHAALVLANARALVDEYLAPALGVNLGFNALDGD